jgi:hypothetical protein
MEHAPLRPVPSRPTGQVDPGAATKFVAARLPGLADDQARALALVALAGQPPGEAALPGLPGTDAATLAAARKELRRSLRRLPGSGWCERAERLISDRLEGGLGERDAARLDVHLQNCPRCTEHERTLVQATDVLVAAFVEEQAAAGAAQEEHGAAAPEEEWREPAELTIVVPDAAPEAEVAPPEEAPPEEAPPEEAPPEAAREPEEAAPVVTPGRPERDVRRIASAVTWNVLFAIAVLLALASLALTVAGILGADL